MTTSLNRAQTLEAFALADAAGDTEAVNLLVRDLEAFDAVSPEDAVAEEVGFLERTGGTLINMGTEISDALFADKQMDFGGKYPAGYEEALGAPKKPMSMRVVDAIGNKAIPAVAEITFDAAISGAQAVLPDAWEDAIIDFSKESLEWVASNELAQEGIKIAEKGVGAYAAWAEKNPTAAEQLSGIINIATLGKTPTTLISRKPKIGPQIKRSGEKQGWAARKKDMAEKLEPIIKLQGPGKTSIDPLTGRTIYETTDEWSLQIAEEVAKVQKVKKSTPNVTAMNTVREKAIDYRRQLEGLLKSRGNPKINLASIQSRWANKINEMVKNPFLTTQGLATGEKLIDLAKQFIVASDGTAMGLLEARRLLDREVRRLRPKAFNADTAGGEEAAFKIVRDVMNDAIDEAVGGDGAIKELLGRQHRLLTAGDTFEMKALKDAETRLGRMVQKIEGIAGFKLPTTPVAQLAVGSTAAATAGVLGGLPTGVAVGTLLAGYKGSRWLMSPAGKQWLGRVITGIEKDPTLMRTLRTDRLALIEFMEQMQEEPDD